MAWLPGRVCCLLSTAPGAIAKVESGLCAELPNPDALPRVSASLLLGLHATWQEPHHHTVPEGPLRVGVLALNLSFPNKQGCGGGGTEVGVLLRLEGERLS